MNIITIIIIALALAIDAFAVSFSAGAYFGKADLHQRFRLSFHFGLFQFLMPIIGWFAGNEIVEYISEYDHWVAFVILLIIGIKMIWDAFNSNNEKIRQDITKGWSLVSLSVATSIDALAVGFSLGIINSSIFFPSIVIGIVAAGLSLLGIKLGEVISSKFGGKISFIGGVVLILIGLNIIAEHLNWY